MVAAVNSVDSRSSANMFSYLDNNEQDGNTANYATASGSSLPISSDNRSLASGANINLDTGNGHYDGVSDKTEANFFRSNFKGGGSSDGGGKSFFGKVLGGLWDGIKWSLKTQWKINTFLPRMGWKAAKWLGGKALDGAKWLGGKGAKAVGKFIGKGVQTLGKGAKTIGKGVKAIGNGVKSAGKSVGKALKKLKFW